jgi:hypothetical protein
VQIVDDLKARSGGASLDGVLLIAINDALCHADESNDWTPHANANGRAIAFLNVVCPSVKANG